MAKRRQKKKYEAKYPPHAGGRPRQWDLEAALALGNDLISWMEEAEDNIFVGEFLCKHGLYKDLSTDLQNRFEEFALIIKKAHELQLFKMVKRSMDKQYATAGVIFALKNMCGWCDKTEFTGRDGGPIKLSLTDILGMAGQGK
jgi:hypothetical protein